MYQILLIRSKEQEDSKIKDYLLLGGYRVMETDLERFASYKKLLDHIDAILFCCEDPETYYVECSKMRHITQIPIIVLTNSLTEWGIIKMFQAGVDDYMQDSVVQGELLVRLKRHIERYRRLTKHFGFIELQGLYIDVFARKVYLYGEELELRTKEFDILLYLAQRPNQVITKQELYTEIWKDELGGRYYNSVAVHIMRLREKVEEDPEKPMILETIWGVGYRLRDPSKEKMM